MRVLHLTNKPIYPLLDGGCVAMNQLSKLLVHQKFTVKNLTIETEKHPFRLEDFPADYRANLQPEAVFLHTELTIKGALKALLSGESYNISRFRSVEFEEALIKVLNESDYDFVFCESVYLLPYIEIIREHSKAKVIARTHNVEFKIWKRLAKQASFIKRWYLMRLSKALKQEELSLLQKSDAIIAISEGDSVIFKQSGITVPITVIRVAMEKAIETVSSPIAKFHHLGSMNWAPNIEAVNHLIHKILPSIRKVISDAELHLAGSFFPTKIHSNPAEGVYVHGFVEDRFQFISNHGIQLVPLKSGSGVRIKLLESLSNGIPIITTPIGAEGLAKGVDSALVIAKNDADFIANAIELYKNDELRQKLSRSAIQYIDDQYSFDSVNKRFIEFLQSIS